MSLVLRLPGSHASTERRAPPLLDPAIVEGIRLFNAHKFFEAHEALEAVWLKAHGYEKLVLHGLIQVAAAFHHYKRGNRAGLRSLLEKGSKKLEGFRAGENGIDLTRLRRQLRAWREYLDGAHQREAPALPQISGAVGSHQGRE